MKRTCAVILMVIALGLPAGAWAAPSFLGPSGLLFVPTADVVGAMQWDAGGAAVWVDEGEDATYVFGNIGLMPKLEFGFSRDDLEGETAETLLNAKYRLLELPARVQVAVGALDITNEVDSTYYAVASHELGAGIVKPHGLIKAPRIHGGVAEGRLDDIFLGFSALVGETAEVLADYDSEEVNVGVRWSLVHDLKLTVAAVHDLDDYAAGLSYGSTW